MELLKHKAQVAVAQISELVVAEVFHRGVVEPVAAAGGAVEAAENIHGRAFAGAGRPHHGQVIPPIDGEIHTIESLNGHLAAAINLVYALKLGNGIAHQIVALCLTNNPCSTNGLNQHRRAGNSLAGPGEQGVGENATHGGDNHAAHQGGAQGGQASHRPIDGRVGLHHI